MNQAIVRGIILLLGVIVALIAGSATANYDIVFLFIGAMCFGALLFVGIVWRYVLSLALWISLLGFSWYPLGFALGADELSYLLVVTLIFTTIWRPFERRPMLDNPTERSLRTFVRIGVVWFIYVGFELVWRLLEIRFYGEAGMKNVLKSYVGILMPTFCLIYFILRPSAILPLRNPVKTFLWMLLVSLTVGIGGRIYQNTFGLSMLDEQSGRIVAGPLVIPGVLIVEGLYVLRTLAPLGALAGILFLTARQPDGRRPQMTIIFLSCSVILLGIVGAFVSGGRASIALVGMFILGVLCLRRAYVSVIACGAVFVLIILMVNVGYRSIESMAPTNVLRSISWMVVDGNTNTSGDIEASTRWRQMIFESSMDEWNSSLRNRIIGRGYKGFADTDYTDSAQAGYYEKIDIALQRGATHSLLSDVLLVFGLIGAFLYYGMLLFQVILGLAVVRTAASSPTTCCFAWIVAIMGMHAIVIGTLGGTFLGMLNMLLVLIMVLECYKDQKSRVIETDIQDGESLGADSKGKLLVGMAFR